MAAKGARLQPLIKWYADKMNGMYLRQGFSAGVYETLAVVSLAVGIMNHQNSDGNDETNICD